MANAPRILVMAGSLRAGSWNKKLARAAAEALRGHGAEVDLLDMREVPMPVYDGDLEEAEGMPAGAQAFKARLAAAEGFLFVSPEYNAGIPGAFKNAIDWASRGEDDVFAGKMAALMSASPGRFGGIRMMPHLRQVMTTLGVWLVPAQLTLPKANEAFDDCGKLIAALHQKQVDKIARALVEALSRRA